MDNYLYDKKNLEYSAAYLQCSPGRANYTFSIILQNMSGADLMHGRVVLPDGQTYWSEIELSSRHPPSG